MNRQADIAYAEFAVQSNFSFLQGASKPEELAVAASLLGYRALGLADRNSVAGVVRAWKAADVAGIAYHPGARLVFCDGAPDMLAYPQDRQGWGHLCRMLTAANERGEKGTPQLNQDDLMCWGDRMSLAVMPDLSRDADDILALLRRYRDRFGGALWLAVAPLHGGGDRWRLEQAAALALTAGVPMMAVNDVLYHAAERRQLQDVVTAIRLNVPVARAGFALNANAERHLKTPAEMARLFARHPGALAETIRFAETLRFSLDELKHFYPDEAQEDPQAKLERLAWEGARWRYPTCIPEKVRSSIATELALIGEKAYAPYFLTVYDIVWFAKGEGILCQGRGSAANSTVCFCLGITEVDPATTDLLFDRFLSTERDEPPDIDVDFEHERRDVVMTYIYEKYSSKRTALAAAVTTYRGRSAMREVAKALGLSEDAQSALSSSIWGWSTSELGERETKAAGIDGTDATARHLVRHANEILEFPRHLTQHVGGFVITQDRLDEIVPIVRTAMEERRMVEWDKDDLDRTGILKVDVLALGMLSCMRRCFDMIERHYGHHWKQRLDLTFLCRDHQPDVYDMICRADTIGVFQIESRAQMSMLPRLKPREFYDLVIEVAIVRPGPIQGDMVHPYLRRREGKETPHYPKPELQAILERTLGVPLFQEQAMQIAITAGGFTPSEADQLRRAMATFKRVGTIGTYQTKLIEGMVKRGYERDFAERCFRQIEGFGEYGFPESHAASFALLVYASAWMKTYYPDVFCAALLNSQPMGFYAPAQLVRDAREHGVEICEPDVNLSEWDCTVEPSPFDRSRIAPRHREMSGVIRTEHAVRLGLRQIKGLPEKAVEALVGNRGAGYESVRDLWLRSGLPRAVIQRLAEADAFRSLGLDRRAALWAVRALDEKGAAERLPLFERPELRLADHEPVVALPSMPAGEHVIQDYRSLSLSLKAHPVSFLRDALDRGGTMRNGELEKVGNGRRVTVSGLVLVRQRPGSAKGVIFMTLEDETGIANIVVWKKTFERFRAVVMGARLVRVVGKLQSVSGVIHVVAERIEDISGLLEQLSEAAMKVDFRAPVDETKRPVWEDRRGTRKVRNRASGAADRIAGNSDPRMSEKAGPEGAAPEMTGSGAVRKVMPKGRNFH
ncbi:error-prone DNA polymerase [Mesorhizobium sp. CAU 1741]|uniref:error-prone DNA polymerase n=1 Tax=Mesorhizobium sp. CAU 1741 TaxID=3140366 RepID=UPI00325AB66A